MKMSICYLILECLRLCQNKQVILIFHWSCFRLHYVEFIQSGTHHFLLVAHVLFLWNGDDLFNKNCLNLLERSASLHHCNLLHHHLNMLREINLSSTSFIFISIDHVVSKEGTNKLIPIQALLRSFTLRITVIFCFHFFRSDQSIC